MRSSEGLQRYKINEMRALKGTDGPRFPAACSVCGSTSGFVCCTVAVGAAAWTWPQDRGCKGMRLPPAFTFTVSSVPRPYSWGPSPDPPPGKLSLLLPLCPSHPGQDWVLDPSPNQVLCHTPLGDADGILSSWQTDTCSHFRGGSCAVGERHGTRSCLLTPALPNEAEGIVGHGKTLQW